MNADKHTLKPFTHTHTHIHRETTTTITTGFAATPAPSRRNIFAKAHVPIPGSQGPARTRQCPCYGGDQHSSHYAHDCGGFKVTAVADGVACGEEVAT